MSALQGSSAWIYAHFPMVDGLVNGAKIVMDGLQWASSKWSTSISKNATSSSLSRSRAQADWVRTDSSVQIATQGVLGDKYFILTRGSDHNLQRHGRCA